jgi:hypothetical protein
MRYKDNYRSSGSRAPGNTTPHKCLYESLTHHADFGTFINHKFGNVEETGIMITLRDMYIEKINRHLSSYKKDFLITWFSHDRQ